MRHPAFTLQPLSLEFSEGERVAIVGPNGSGKTTALRAIAGRLAHYEGSILLDGTELRTLLPLGRRMVGLLPETMAGYGWMTVREHLAFLRQFYPEWDADYAEDLTERLRVPLGAVMSTLSKGTRVKVSFISAEAYRPPILLLDEPTSGLDPHARSELIGSILAAAEGQPRRVILFSTHLLEDVDHVADRVLLLTDGVLRLDMSVAELRDRHGGARLSTILYATLSRPESA